MDERRKSALIIQKFFSKKNSKQKKKSLEKKEFKRKLNMMSLAEKNLFNEAKDITKRYQEETIKEQEKLNESLV